MVYVVSFTYPENDERSSGKGIVPSHVFHRCRTENTAHAQQDQERPPKDRHMGTEAPYALSMGTENSSLREEQVRVSLLTYPKGLLRK